MDSSAPTRSASEASSSCSSDFYSADPTVAQQLATSSDIKYAESAAVKRTEQSPYEDNDQDSSSSDMDLSSPSPPATPLPPSKTAIAMTVDNTGAKRKLTKNPDAETADSSKDSLKKRKLVASQTESVDETAYMSLLPPEIWQRVFQYLHPVMLGRCLSVCRDFKHYLTGLSAQPSHVDYAISAVTVMDSETVWAHSRKTFLPKLPRPLASHSELDMLQLIGCRTCQFCGRSPQPAPCTTLFNAGPAVNGVRVIWPFGIRTCGLCLHSRMIKDIDTLQDPLLKDIRKAVPFGFFSSELHFASNVIRRTRESIPANLRFLKFMYLPDLEYMKAEEENAKSLGLGAVDEWRKGLEQHGQEVMADSARWEQWEFQQQMSHGPGTDISKSLREYDVSSVPRIIEQHQNQFPGVINPQPLVSANGAHPLPLPVHVFSHGNNFPYHQAPSQFPRALPAQTPFPQSLPLPPLPRTARTREQAEEVQKARKADVERRCLEMDPPLLPDVLRHMEAFNAAIKISLPMTDELWEQLRPRLAAQRYDAEQAENERKAQMAAFMASTPSAVSSDAITRQTKESNDREYEQSQAPLRRRLLEYAQDYIDSHWAGGKGLDRDNVPIFAVQVLLHVQKRYDEDASQGLLPISQHVHTSGQNTPSFSQPFLSLENMKWVYDHKVRPLTDLHRREHFICAGCADEEKEKEKEKSKEKGKEKEKEKSPKWFAFEGLIQHYGAKHTSAFSNGNIVVHWRSAQWPDEPPFHVNPGHWLQSDRRVPHHKHHNRARGTPQSNSDNTLPASERALRPMDAQSRLALGEYTSTNSMHDCTPHDGRNGYPYSNTTVAGMHGLVTYDKRLKKFASDARETWDALEGIKDLETCVRVQTSLHHAFTQFHESFHEQPSLETLVDALTTDGSMRPLKNAKVLACRSCVAFASNATSEFYYVRTGNATLFNTPELVTHFKLMHVPNEGTGNVKWLNEMLETPGPKEMKELLHTVGMDDEKLAILAAAFPTSFPTPLPQIGAVTNSTDSAPRIKFDKTRKKPKSKSKKKSQILNLPEDEYDPRRPMVSQPQQELSDPSQFDTDARKPSEPPALPAGILDVNALAALHAAMGGTAPDAQNQDTSARSPSVGRSPPPSTSRAAGNRAAGVPAEAPDISAILASLTGGSSMQTPRSASSVNYVSTGVASPARPDSYTEQYSKNAPFGNADDTRPNGRATSYGATPDIAASQGLRELQAALSQKHRSYEPDQRQNYASTAAPEPARYQQRDTGDFIYSHPSSLHPKHREAPPAVEYVHVFPGRDFATPGYQYERVAPPTIYVDQYGTPLELILQEPASGPVRHVSNESGPWPHSGNQEHPIYTPVPPGGHYTSFPGDRVYHQQTSTGGNGFSRRHV